MVAPEVTTPARRVVAVAEALGEEALHRLQPEAQRVPALEEQPEAEQWISSGQRQEEPETATLCRLILVVRSTDNAPSSGKIRRQGFFHY